MTNSVDKLGRQMCYSCTNAKLDPYGCVRCGAIVDMTARTTCYLCLISNTSGWECAYGQVGPAQPTQIPPPPPPWPDVPRAPGTFFGRKLAASPDESAAAQPEIGFAQRADEAKWEFASSYRTRTQESQRETRQQQGQQHNDASGGGGSRSRTLLTVETIDVDAFESGLQQHVRRLRALLVFAGVQGGGSGGAAMGQDESTVGWQASAPIQVVGMEDVAQAEAQYAAGTLFGAV
jgi:hypothetical protein